MLKGDVQNLVKILKISVLVMDVVSGGNSEWPQVSEFWGQQTLLEQLLCQKCIRETGVSVYSAAKQTHTQTCNSDGRGVS